MVVSDEQTSAAALSQFALVRLDELQSPTHVSVFPTSASKAHRCTFVWVVVLNMCCPCVTVTGCFLFNRTVLWKGHLCLTVIEQSHDRRAMIHSEARWTFAQKREKHALRIKKVTAPTKQRKPPLGCLNEWCSLKTLEVCVRLHGTCWV